MATPLDAEVKEHRLWFEVHRESAVWRERRVTVALQLWIWGQVPKGEGALPDSPGCRATFNALSAAVAAALARAGAAPAPDVEPFHWALYASKQVPGADELRVEVNLRAEPGDAAAQAAREANVLRLKKAFEALGVFEGGWRALHGAPARAARDEEPERWAVRPAAAALGGAAATGSGSG